MVPFGPIVRAFQKLASAFFVLSAVGSTGCASPLVGLAEKGDYAELGKRINAKHAKGELSDGEAKSVARAIASRELRVAKPEARMARVQEVEPCALAVDDALEDVAEGKDDAAGEAAYYLLDEHDFSRSFARKQQNNPNPYFRRLYARVLDSSSDGEARRAALLDGSHLVRRAAVRAAVEAEDEKDEETLFETVRLDPDHFTRAQALRAIMEIDSSKVMDPTRAQRLADMWDRLDEPLRGDVGVLWTMKPFFDQGGSDHLRALLGRSHGSTALHAASAVLRSRRGAPIYDLALSVLKAHIDEGDTQSRSQAILMAPLDLPVLLASVKQATTTPDTLVQARAHGRLLELEKEHDAAVTALEKLAAREDATGQNARMFLARHKDFRIQAWIERDLVKGDLNTKLFAVRALAQLDRVARAAPLLVDTNVTVRTRVACMMLLSK